MRLNQKRLSMQRNTRHSGDRCECSACQGFLIVENTRIKREVGVRVQYLACNECGWRPEDNKLVHPLALFPPRK